MKMDYVKCVRVCPRISMNPEEKKEYDEDPMFIPYTDRVVFEYGGGAAGPQSFGEDIKEEFMKKHQFLRDENNDN